MNKIVTLFAAAALVAGMSGSVSAQEGLAGLGAGVTTGTVIGITLAGFLIIALVADDGTVTTTTVAPS